MLLEVGCTCTVSENLLFVLLSLQCNIIIIVSNPAHWAKMPVDGSGKELVWHPVTLSPTDQEYKEVLQEFEKTMTTGFYVSEKDHYTSILAIKRIQNPTLYGRYIMRRKQMNEANPTGHQNERRLFHGCPVDAVENINKTGYKRSYCNSNGMYVPEIQIFEPAYSVTTCVPLGINKAQQHNSGLQGYRQPTSALNSIYLFL